MDKFFSSIMTHGWVEINGEAIMDLSFNHTERVSPAAHGIAAPPRPKNGFLHDFDEMVFQL
jgi:hypothetical protein